MSESPGFSPKRPKAKADPQGTVVDAWGPLDLPDPGEREEMEHIDAALQKLRKRVREGAALADLELPSAVKFGRDLGVSARTVQRLIRKMKDLHGAPIEFDPRRKGYYYLEDVVFQPFVQMSESELVAVYLSQQLAAFEGTPFKPRLKLAFRKMLGLFGAKLSFDPGLLDDCFSFDADGPHARFRPEHLDLCARAMLRQEELVLNYTKEHGAGAGVPEVRLVRPLHITYRDFAYYVLCEDPSRDTPRLFMVTRMNDVQETGVKFKRPRGFDARAYLDRAFKVFASSESVKVVLEFAKSAQRRVTERRWHSTQKFEKLGDGGVRMLMDVGLAPDLFSWIGGFFGECRVVEPVCLRERIRELHEEGAEAQG